MSQVHKKIINLLIESDGKCVWCQKTIVAPRWLKELNLTIIKIMPKTVTWIDATLALRKELRATVDHLTPSSRGGSNRKENLVASCSGCNNKRGNEIYTGSKGQLLEAVCA